MPIKVRTFFSQSETDLEGLKISYKTWADGALNVPTEDRPLYFFNHHVISGIEYQDFKNLIKEEEEHEETNL